MSQHYLADRQPEARPDVNRAGKPGAVSVSPSGVRLMNPTTIESAICVPEEFMKNAIAGPREVVGHVVHGRHQSTVSENSASHIQTSKQPVEDKMEPMNFMG